MDDRRMLQLGPMGKTDQMGAVNLITDAKRREAAGLVREGVSVSLAHNPITEKAPDNDSPFRHNMLSTGQHPSGQFVLDEYDVSYHGLAHTHMDTLCHMSWNGKMYNGFPQTDVTDRGAKELAITNYKNAIFTRGVLFDIPRLKGKPWLEPSDGASGSPTRLRLPSTESGCVRGPQIVDSEVTDASALQRSLPNILEAQLVLVGLSRAWKKPRAKARQVELFLE